VPPKNLALKIDFRSELPIYSQIVEQIRRRLAAGDLSPGDQLPTVRQLAIDLQVNFNTVARAYRLLDEAGLISTQQGRGTYIWETLSPERSEKLHHQALHELTRAYLDEAASLGFSPDEVRQCLQDEFEAGLSQASAG
jgi:GntR family transcriptional regulator